MRVPFLDYLAQGCNDFPASGYDHIFTRKSYDDVELRYGRVASIGNELASKRAKMLIYIDRGGPFRKVSECAAWLG